jgi:hypothetical protein
VPCVTDIPTPCQSTTTPPVLSGVALRVAIKSEKLVSQGHFDGERITELLLTEPAKHPGCSGTRYIAGNINDLKAQVAANQKSFHHK